MIEAQPKPHLAKILGNFNFRLFSIGQRTSLLGDQFFLIAIPWLVLRLTNNSLALGRVMGLAGIPRALFMLLGGAVTDYFTPRGVMLVSDLFRLLLVDLLTVLIVAGEPFDLILALHSTSYVFRSGNRIRLTVAFAVPDNFDTPIITPSPTLEILRDVSHASFVELPIVGQR